MESASTSEQQFLNKLTAIIDANLHNEQFGVNDLAAELGMSRITLYRRVKSVVKKSVSEFIREVRMKRSHELLLQKTGTVSEIAYQVGFGSVQYFTRCFHQHYGYPPGELLKGMHPPVEPKSNKKSFWTKLRTSKILYFFLIIFFLAAVFYMVFQNKQRCTIEKTVAVLPPKDISPEGSSCIILEGFREDLQSKLYSMSNLMVSSGTTTDTYRASDKNLQLIAKELDVNFIVEIREQYIDNMNTIWIQLIEAKTDKHIWAGKYSRGLENERVHEIQQEIALSVAANLNITISPQELKIIEKRPTTSEAAYRFYLQGLNYLSLYEQDRQKIHFKNAKNVFEKSLKIDSTFADAYLQMAHIYINNLAWTYTYNDWGKYFNYLDSGFVMIDKAKKLRTSDMSKAFRLEADYYQRIGMDEKALSTFEKSWKHKNKNFEYYLSKSNFQYFNLEYSESIKNFFFYYESKPNTLLLNPTSLSRLINNLIFTGFPATAKKFAKEMLKISNDTLQYKNILCWIDYLTGNFEAAEKGVLEFYNSDTTNLYIISQLMDINVYLHDIEDALFYFNKLHGTEVEMSQNFRYDVVHGYLYKITGQVEKAEEMFNNEIEMLQEQIRLNTYFAQELFAYGRLAGIYAAMGEKELALINLQKESQRKTIPLWVIDQTHAFPLFDNIRSEPEFKEIMDNMRTKYLLEHNKVGKLLRHKSFEPS